MTLSELKSATLEEAKLQAIPIEFQGQSLGSLVPVGPWILGVSDLICQISAWRCRAMRMFLIQFDSTPSKTEDYLLKFSVGQRDRILFMIEAEGSFVGHIGLAKITDTSAELDNLMRGSTGGSSELMKASERTLIRWAFMELGLQALQLRILSYNIFAKVIHEEMGFQTFQRSNLRRVFQDEMTTLEECSEQAANVAFTCDHMILSREVFIMQTLSVQNTSRGFIQPG